MKRSSSASRRPLERGQFSWVTFLLLTMLVVGTYLAIVWVPVFIVHRQIQGLVRESVNKAIRDKNDQKLVLDLCRRIAALQGTEIVDDKGRVVTVPAVDLSPSDVSWERDTSVTPPTLRVSFEYVRVVEYPLLDRTEELVLSVDYSDEIGVPKW